MTRDEAIKIVEEAEGAEKLLALLENVKNELIAESVTKMINSINSWDEFQAERAYIRAIHSIIAKLTHKKSLYTINKEAIQKALGGS